MKKKTIDFVAVLLPLLFSCSGKLDDLKKISSDECQCDQEVAFPNMSGEVASFTTKDERILSYETIEGVRVFEGDILLSDQLIDFLKKEDTTSYNAGRVSSAPGALLQRWTNSTVNFHISLGTRRDDVLWAINHVEVNTSIDFVESQNGNYIDFVLSEGCSSQLGMQGGRQTINLAPGCGRGAIVHEICHALGVFHEQSRPDRDGNVIIHWANIESGKLHNFETRLAHNYGLFDFGSVMMYSSYAFSSNGQPTITMLSGLTYPTPRTSLSTDDISALRDMYPGPDMIRSIEGAIDIGGNNNGDVVYCKQNQFYVDVYKNGAKVLSYRTTGDLSVDITATGSLLTSYEGFTYGSGKFNNYSILDVSEGGGNVYCLATNSTETSLFFKNGNTWIKMTGSGKRLTVDQRGRPWMLSDSYVSFPDGDGFTSIGMPAYSSLYDRFIDIGSAGNEIYASMKNLKSGATQLLKYSHTAKQFIRQPGGANRLDGGIDGLVWFN